MKRFIIFFLLGISFSAVVAKQECDSNSSNTIEGIFDFLSILGSGNDDSEDRAQPARHKLNLPDVPREENFEVRYGASFMSPKRLEMNAEGLELGLYSAASQNSNLYVGASFSYHNYGVQSYDTLFGEYDKITTSNNIYGIGLLAKQRIINTDVFKMYVGLETGLLFFHSFSSARDIPKPCECKEPNMLLEGWNNTRFKLGPTVDLSIPFASNFDRFNLHIGYQMMGVSDFVNEGDVEISPNRINFLPSKQALNWLNVQIGFSHFFLMQAFARLNRRK